jgi:hypothetical protein
VIRARLADRGIAALLAALALACAAGRPSGAGEPAGAGPGSAAASGLELWLRGDPAAAAERFRRRPDDPWARAGAAALARRGIDPAAEAGHLVALVRVAPAHPLAIVALRRLAELAEVSPERAREVDVALAELLRAGRLSGLAAYRARIGRIAAAEATGELERAVALRAETGAVSAWTLAGPFGRRHALDFDVPYAPERGELPVSVPGPPGLPDRRPRPLPAPDGLATLDGEPGDGDVFYLASDAELSRGGAYLLAVGSTASLKLLVDGAPVVERRAFEGHPPTLRHVAIELAPGRHRILAKVSRGPQPNVAVHVALARSDGAPSDATFAPTPEGAPPLRAEVGHAPVGDAASLGRALRPGGPAGLLFAARDAAAHDREGAKALLAEGLAGLPRSAALLAARAEVVLGDRTRDAQAARASAESDLRGALEADPGDASARLLLAAIQRDGERLDDAEETLAGLPDAEGARDAAAVARARLALARGLPERAEVLAAGAAAGGACEALGLVADAALRREAVARADRTVEALVSCPGGRERLARHRLQRGDPRGALAALDPAAIAQPSSIEVGLARAGALLAAGDPAAADRALEVLLAYWPRSSRIALRLADARELAGDRAGARATRERALLLDGSNLRLRRALALEDGTEVLAGEAEDAAEAIRAYQAARPEAGTSAVMVLDAAAVEIHPDGTATERTHQVFHVVDQQGVDRLGETNVPPGSDVLALRTIKPDGRTLEPDLTAGGKDSISLAGLEPGDYVRFEFVRAIGSGHGAAGPGGFAADPFYFQVAGTPLFRSVYSVSAPRGAGLAVDAHNMEAPDVRIEGDREVVRALRARVPAVVPEPGAPGLQEVLPFLQVGIGGGREAFQLALGDAVLESSRPTEEIRTYARSIRAAAGQGATPLALARAAHARIARDVLGQGSSLAEEASEVLSRGRGSRLVLLKAVLDELGVPSRIAMVRPFASDPAPYRFPGPAEYAAPLLRVEAGREPVWLDPGLRQAPFGAIPAALLGCEALLLPEPGEAPRSDRTPDRVEPGEGRDLEVEIALGPDGDAVLSGTDRYLGHGGAAAKAAVERLDADARRRMVEGALARSFRGVAVENFSIEGEDDRDVPLALRWRARAPALARDVAGGARLEWPLLPFRLSARYVQVAARRTPLLVAAPERAVQRVRIVPPPGLVPVAGAPLVVEGPGARYVRSERVEGGALVREERLEIERARVAPAQYPAFAEFAGRVDAIQMEPVVLERRGDPGVRETQGAPSGNP